MSDWSGRFDKSGSPTLTIEVAGLTPVSRVFDAIIDTGFSGFLAIPLSMISIPRSVVAGFAEITLADGAKYRRLYAPATVRVQGDTLTENAIIEPDSGEVIIGMSFLRRFGRGLVLRPAKEYVVLPEDSEL